MGIQKHVITVDSRRRATLSDLAGVVPGARYLARTEPDGTIIMEPAAVLSAVTKQPAVPMLRRGFEGRA